MGRGIFERTKGSGIWWVRYTDQYGKLHREKVGPKSLAKAAYQKRKTEIREGKFFPERVQLKQRILFRDMARLYLEEHSKINNQSWKTDMGRLERITKHFGETPLNEITKQDVERFRARLIRTVSPSTANRYIASLKSLFNRAIEWKKCNHNPVRGIKQFKETHRIRFLTDEEEKRLEAVFRTDYWPWVEVAFHTGMRRAEQFGLRWENVNFQSGIITIPHSKSGEVRHIAMNDRVIEILRNLPSRMKCPWVFTSSNEQTPMDSGNFVKYIFRPAVKEAEIEDFRWHDLRHTFASRLVMDGTDLKTVQELMGHKTIAMTMKYAHLSPGHKFEAVQRLVKKPTDTRTDTKKKRGRVYRP